MIGRPQQRIVMHKSHIVMKGKAVTTATWKKDGQPDARLSLCAFDVHPRFGTLLAGDVCSRLQLAALYAATGGLLPEARAGMTGGEHALELVRQCWVNRPLTAAERRNLEVLARFSSMTPATALLCDEVCRSSRELTFLHEAASDESAHAGADGACVGGQGGPLVNVLAATEYQLPSPIAPRNARLKLTADEEERCLGQLCHAGASAGSAARLVERVLDVELPPPHRGANLARWVQHELDSMIREVAAPSDASTPFPLTLEDAAHDSEIGKAMRRALRDSWEAHGGCAAHALAAPTDAMNVDHPSKAGTSLDTARTLLSKLCGGRSKLEAAILTALNDIPVGQHKQRLGFRARRAGNDVPIASTRDLVSTSFGAAQLRDFNQFLSDSSVVRLRAAILQWMELCVLEDRLERILAHLHDAVDSPASADLAVREMRVRRTFDVSAHPEWLAFEVEGGIQIRPEQHAVIRDLIEHPPDKPGAIAQLNMGQGKTRVIVPCLVLHWARARAPIVRLHFLSQLLDEAADHLHSKLTASLLGRKLFRMPFCRDVELTEGRLHAMRSSLLHCQRVGGALIIAPEHVLSLMLKELELGMQSSANVGVQRQCAALRSLPCANVYDECDEILSHRRQLVRAPRSPQHARARVLARIAAPRCIPCDIPRFLVLRPPLHCAPRQIYAVGASEALPAGDRRWCSVFALLQLVRHERDVRQLFTRNETATWAEDALAERFDDLQLLAGAQLDRVVPRLREALARALIDRPSSHTRALAKLADVRGVQAVVRALTDVTISVDAAVPTISACARDELLSVRGLLAGGVLEHCLQKRHRVDFGVARDGSHRKRLAVPFVAADTPSQRSEFQHPDVQLVFTVLAYYADGLSGAEVRQTFEKLLSAGLVAQRTIYAEWFVTWRDGGAAIDEADARSIDSIDKVDLSNAVQFRLLEAAFARHMLVINHFLANLVFPVETGIFPHSLLATPWHTCGNAARQVGFSGTNDLALLMPLAVEQISSSSRELRATDGLMLSRLLTLADYALVADEPAQDGGAPPAARALARYAAQHAMRALIDVGAQMAGLPNQRVAELLATELQTARSTCRGVAFFDAAQRAWAMLDVRTGRTCPLRSSPISERDAFCFFDESRCRGADLKLEPTAVALLTLSLRLCKSALMQAAGRMRGLGFGQRVRLAARPDVDAKVRACARVPAGEDVAVWHVLEFVTANSATAAATGLTQWARHGAHFATTRDCAQASVLDDRSTLEALYADARGEDCVATATGHIVRSAVARREACNPVADAQPVPSAGNGALIGGRVDQLVLDRVQARASEFGTDVMCTHSMHDDEAEREVEQEEEEEEEVEREVACAKPIAEYDWVDDAVVACARSAAQLAHTARAKPLKQFIAEGASKFGCIAWPSDRIFLTANFAATIAVTGGGLRMPPADFWRAVDAMLLFPDGSLFLISEREHDALLARCFAADARLPVARWLGSGARALDAHAVTLTHFAFVRDAPPLSAGDAASGVHIDDAVVAAVQLFAGETTFAPARRVALAAMVHSAEAAAAARELVAARGTRHLLDRSVLQDVILGVENAV